jgi:hypothetical protein
MQIRYSVQLHHWVTVITLLSASHGNDEGGAAWLEAA